MIDGGQAPDVLTDLDLCQRLGWSLDVLDKQDMERVLPGIYAQNLRDALGRVRRFLDTQGKVMPTNDDLLIWDWANKTMKDEA